MPAQRKYPEELHLSTPVAHLPDNGAIFLGFYATMEQPGEISLGDQVELRDKAAVHPA